MNKVAIICDGKKIAYGFNLLHLFSYKTETEQFMCETLSKGTIDIYSLAAYQHSNISKSAVKIFMGNTKPVDTSYTKRFDKYGIQIYSTGLVYVVKADDKTMTDSDYDSFISFANEQYIKYYSREKNYVDKVESYDQSWIKKDFRREDSKGIFGKSDLRTKQLYDCAAYILFDILDITSEV